MDSFEVKEMTLVHDFDIIDGSTLFDTMSVSEDLPIIERNFRGYRWYKHYTYDFIANSTECCNDDLIATIMVPLVGSDHKKAPATVHFDFESQTMKVKHMSSYAVSDEALISLIASAT